MKIGIIEFPGTNCERESAEAIRRAGMNPVSFLWNRDPRDLQNLDGYLIAGGFSYEDRSRSGVIAALEPLIPYLKNEIEKGKPLIGICNGAQVLVETGLVPGLPDYQPGAALAANRRIKNGEIVGTGFYNAWVHIALDPNLSAKADSSVSHCAFTSNLKPGEILSIPAAHAEGRFIIPDELLHYMIEHNMTVFRYCNEEGSVQPEFPINPNGSVYNLAGICNREGNVLALMPHPERTEAGDAIFTSMRDYIERRNNGDVQPDEAESADMPIPEIDSKAIPYVLSESKSTREDAPIREDAPTQESLPAREVVVEMIITDNEAVSVENALRHRGIQAAIKRHTHWEITFPAGTSDETMRKALKAAEESGELYNPNKEFRTQSLDMELSRSILIRDLPGEDSIGDHKTHALKTWFNINAVDGVRRGVIWTIIPDTDDPEEAKRVCDEAESTHIFSNPYANRRYTYAGQL